MLRADRLIGREPVLAAAGAVLRDALAGSGQLLTVTGEAGIGKTAVLAALVDQAGPDAMVLQGFCLEGTGVPPYWPWSQVLRATGVSASELGEADWLMESGSPEALSAAAAADAQFRLFEAISRCLGKLAAGRPVLVVLDDLHWADEASLRLLDFLARSLAGDRVLLLGAFRGTEASAELRRLAGNAHQLALTGLSSSEVDAMVKSLVPDLSGLDPSPMVTAQLWQRSGGNPFFVGELTRLLVAQGTWHESTQIPASVSETLQRRLARLSTACVRLLEWAAVAGRDIEVGLLVRGGAASDEATARSLLDEARLAGVVASDTELRFAHDLYRETLLDDLSPADRMATNLSVGLALQGRVGTAARVATHLFSAGAQAQQDAVKYSLLAAREATARLGHADACAHYLRALHVIDDQNLDGRSEILLALAAAHARAGDRDLARRRFQEAAAHGREDGEAIQLALAALGVQSLGNRSGAQNAELLAMLREASEALETAYGSAALRSRVLAAEARTIRHGRDQLPGPGVVQTAQRAVELATEAQDPEALAMAKLAVHDVTWVPGTAQLRLPVLAEMLDAAQASADADLVAEAHLLRAGALLELGDPAGRDELLTYINMAGNLGHARGRWSALTRQATFAQLAGRAEEAAQLGEQALELGLAIGEPDAIGCFATSRYAMIALGAPEPDIEMGTGDPLWPMFPLLAAWPPAARGDAAAAAAALGDFSVLDIARWTGLEGLACAAVVFAAAGSDAQRRWTYDELRPYAGTHVIVGGCASYHAAVDHHLGSLAASLDDITAAEQHFRDALAMHQRLGAAGWVRLSERALAELLEAGRDHARNRFRLVNGVRLLSFGGTSTQLPDSKGLRDLATLIGAHGSDVHVLTLVGHETPRVGADPVLDRRAKAEFRARLNALEVEIEEAELAELSDIAEELRGEREALIHELAAATGLGGRDRRLGDETERARKTVSARVREAIAKIERVDPELAGHLHVSLRMGAQCSYVPPEPTTWDVT